MQKMIPVALALLALLVAPALGTFTLTNCKAEGGDRAEWACNTCSTFSSVLASTCYACLQFEPNLPAPSCTHTCTQTVAQAGLGIVDQVAAQATCIGCIKQTDYTKQPLCGNCISKADALSGSSFWKAIVRSRCNACMVGGLGWDKINDWQCQDFDGLSDAAQAANYLDCLKIVPVSKLNNAWVCKQCPAGQGTTCGNCVKNTPINDAWKCLQ